MNNSYLLAALLTVASALPASAQSLRLPPATSSGVRSADHIVALVNSEPITNGEVRARIARIETPPGASLPPKEELARQVLERLIQERTQIQHAIETGLKVDESQVNDAEAMVAQQNGLSPDQLRKRVVASGMTIDAFRTGLRNDILLQRVRERDVEGRVRVSELEIDAYLREHQGPVALEQTVFNLAQVLIRVPEGASNEALAALQARAADVTRRARAGEDFAALARAYSDSPEGQAGGMLGLRPADRYPTLFVDAIKNLKPGQTSEPVRSGAGFHVLMVLEKRNPNLPDPQYTQTQARHILLRPAAGLTQEAAVERLKQFREQILAGKATFDGLARQHSQDGSASAGGDLGWASPGQFVPEFERVMNGLAPGQISEPLVSRFGVHLIQVMQRRQAEMTQRELREWVRNVLRERKTEQAYQDWVQDLRGRAYVEYREPPQ